ARRSTGIGAPRCRLARAWYDAGPASETPAAVCGAGGDAALGGEPGGVVRGHSGIEGREPGGAPGRDRRDDRRERRGEDDDVEDDRASAPDIVGPHYLRRP